MVYPLVKLKLQNQAFSGIFAPCSIETKQVHNSCLLTMYTRINDAKNIYSALPAKRMGKVFRCPKSVHNSQK